MSKFEPYEIKTLKFFNKLFNNSIPGYNTFVSKLKTYGYEDEEFYDLYKLYLNNFREEGDYESVETPDRGDLPLVRVVKEIINNESLTNEDIAQLLSESKIMGNKFYYGDGGYSYRRNRNSLHGDHEGLYLDLSREDWEKYFSGLSEDDVYYYHMSQSSYDHYDWDFESSDEKNYMLNGYPDDYRKNLSDLARMVGDLGFSDKILNHNEEEGEFVEFLEKYFPDEVEDVLDDYYSELGSVRTSAAGDAVTECYEESVTYTSKDGSDIFIPWENLLTIIEENNMVTLSDLYDVEINSGMSDLSSCWWEAWPSKEEFYEVYRTIDRSIEKLIEKLDDGGLDEINSRISNSKKMWDLVRSLGFVSSGGKYYKKTTNGVEIIITDFDVESGKFHLKVTYPQKYSTSKWSEVGKYENIVVNMEDLGTWVTSLPLDRQDESLRLKNLVENVRLKGIIHSFLKRI